ncbi:hypothetical protein H4R19_000917 [Coemansia spiralis]|nr:hypothetical protein H4R19_000917 [Coemansia spiralis]
MSSKVLYDAPSEFLAAEPARPTHTVPTKPGIVKRVFALFACEALLVVLAMAVFRSSPALSSWYRGQAWLRLGTTISTVVTAAYVVMRARPTRGVAAAALLFSAGQALQFGFIAAADTTQLLPNVVLKTFALAIVMTVGSIVWPQKVLHWHQTVLASPVSMPLVWLAWLALLSRDLQLAVVMLVLGILTLALLTYYTPLVTKQYSDDQWCAAGIELYYSVVMRIILVMVSVCVAFDQVPK